MDDPIKYLADAIDKAGLKITFGLQPYHIERIESEQKRLNDIQLDDTELNNIKADMIYSRYIWEKLGKEFGWEPFTLALYYFEYLSQKV